MGRCILRDIVDIFRTLVASLGQTVEIKSQSKVGNTYTFLVDYTYWLRPKSEKSIATQITIGSTAYNVDSLVKNTSVTVTTTDDLSAATSFTVAAPYFFNGTKIATNKKRRNKNSWEMCPFIWIAEPFVTNETKDRMSIVEAEPNLTVFFLDNSRADDWDTTQVYSNVIDPLVSLVDEFYNKIRKTRSEFKDVTGWRVVKHAVFGKESDNGAISSIFNDKLAGIEVNFSVQILKTLRTCQ